MKNTLTNRKCEELFYPQKSEDVRSHSNNSIENATPSNGTSPEASYKEVPPPPPPNHQILRALREALLP